MALTLLIIPTKNEHKTIHRVMEEVTALGLDDLHVLVTDDDSIDGTWRTYGTRWAADSERNHLLRRCGPQKGRGYALRESYQWALDHVPRYDFVLEMAGNGTDDPSLVPALIEKLADGCDVVVAERGEGTGGSGAEARRTQSFAKFATGAPVQDVESGFRGYRRGLLEQVVRKLKSKHHEIKAEILAAAVKRGARFGTVPTTARELPSDAYAQGGESGALKLTGLFLRRLTGGV